MPSFNPQRAAQRADQDDKAKEVAYVRAEKAGDDSALAKLSEKYGDGNKKSSSDVRKRVWTCHECEFRNVDTRDVCGKCLAPNSAIISVEKQSVNDLIPARGTLDPTAKVHVVGGRAYRDYFQHGLDAKKMKNIMKQTQQQIRQHNNNNNNNTNPDEEDCEDEPNCRFQPPSSFNKPQHEGDDEEEEDDDYEDDDYAMNEDGGVAHNNNEGSAGYGYYDYEQEEEEFMRQQEEQEEDEDGIRYDSKRQSYILKMNCRSRFWKFIIGSKGKTLQDIQRMTGATLILPKNASDDSSTNNENDESSTIEITGPTKSAVSAARLKVEAIILDNQDRVEYTHFLSLPLASNSQSKAAFAGYLQDMVRKCVDEERRIDPFMFQIPSKIHLTLLMLRLHSKEDIEKAKSLLVVIQAWIYEMFAEGSGANSSKVTFKGVNYMNDDPTEVHVLYLDLVRDEAYKKLVDLIQKINSLFIDSGLALPKDVAHNEKLHATILNSKWRGGDIVDGTLANYASSGGRISFDASEVLRLYGANGQTLLGSHKLGRLDLSILGAGTGADGYYSKVDSAFFP